MLTPSQLFTEAQAIVDAGYASVEQCDRHAFALALFFQGYSAGQACHKAFVELEDTDGALQMLARHREALATVAAANDEGVEDDTVAFIQDWLMNADYDPTQFDKDFAAAIDARVNAGIEAAAQVAENRWSVWADKAYNDTPQGDRAACADVAAAIRLLPQGGGK